MRNQIDRNKHLTLAPPTRCEAGKKLLDAMQRLRAANVPPLTEEEIAAKVQAVRAARRAAGETADDQVLVCALAVEADLVSGDSDLLGLKQYEC